MLAELLVMWLVNMGKGEGDYISFTKSAVSYEYFIYKSTNRIWAIQTSGPKLVPFAAFGKSSQYQLWLHNIKK